MYVCMSYQYVKGGVERPIMMMSPVKRIVYLLSAELTLDVIAEGIICATTR